MNENNRHKAQGIRHKEKGRRQKMKKPEPLIDIVGEG